MKMLRHYFISDSLDDLELFEEQLEAHGVSTPQIHVLSPNDSEVERHSHLHGVPSFMKSDVVHSTLRGAVIGIGGAALILLVAYFAGWTDSPAGWVPFIFLAVVVLGFCTWEAGFFGLQQPNHNFKRFEQALNAGKHVFFVDLLPEQESVLESVLKLHPKIEQAGTGTATRHWLVAVQQRLGIVRHA